ncbi:putative claudin-24 [Engraulis encrasicolus]|uniref:putative claudin-24 n=1 Tax=Engraulis encrasicolus TaxID=184585 RepID=UPI002FD293C4
MDKGAWVLELLGVFFCILAWLVLLSTTMMSQWLTLSTDLLPAESYELGLWETCVVQEVGIMECSPYDSLLGLPPDIRLARILMCAAVATGLLAFAFAVPGMHVVNSCQGTETLQAKRALKMLAGILCLATGVLDIIPPSYIAHLTVLRFFDESVPEVVPRWEFGQALFWGWAAALLHLAAGGLLVSSCVCVQDEQCPVVGAAAAAGVPLQRRKVMTAEMNHKKRSTEYV